MWLLQCIHAGDGEQRRKWAFMASGEATGIRRRWLLCFGVHWRGFVARYLRSTCRVRLCQVLCKTTSTLKSLSAFPFRARMDQSSDDFARAILFLFCTEIRVRICCTYCSCWPSSSFPLISLDDFSAERSHTRDRHCGNLWYTSSEFFTLRTISLSGSTCNCGQNQHCYLQVDSSLSSCSQIIIHPGCNNVTD